MKCLLLILALMVPQIAAARLGEAPEQCNKRYGEIISVDSAGAGALVIYAKGDFKITAGFLGGVCHTLIFQRKDGRKIDDDTLDLLLAKNSKFKVALDDASQKFWTCDDAEMPSLAQYRKMKRQLTIVSKAWIEFMKKKTSSDALKATDGF